MFAQTAQGFHRERLILIWIHSSWSFHRVKGISSRQLLCIGRCSARLAWLLLGRCGNLLALLSEQVVHLEVDTVCPAETDDIGPVTCGDFYVGGAADDVV